MISFSNGAGNFVLGQDQDSFNGGYSTSQSLDGQLDDLFIF